MPASWKDPRFSLTRLLLAGVLGILIGGVGVGWYLRDQDPTGTIDQVMSVLPTSLLGAREPAPTKRLEDWLVTADQEPSEKQINAFLEERGRDAESLG